METPMNSYRRVFPGRHTVLPVIHVASEEQAQRNARLARDAGADGVFLINHGMADNLLLDIHQTVADAHPGWWVGVNCLGLLPDRVFAAVSPKVSGVWADNAGIVEDRETQTYAELVLAFQKAKAPHCLYFGGVAFKYQRPVEDLEAACRIAARYMDVVTTSGPGTGQKADVDKIRRMKLALGDTPLAIASGITPENVGDYLPHADSFLVATGISQSFTELDAARLRALVERVRGFAEPKEKGDPLRLVSITRGAEFEIDLSAFPEADPVFAYVDDVEAGVEVLHGLVIEGRMTIPDRQKFKWLDGPRDCVVLKVTAEGRRDQRAAFISLGVGEFCLEIYHVRPDQSVVLLHENDFIFK